MDSPLKEFSSLPKFPDGRIDYSQSDIAPVVTVFVRYWDKILLLKRSGKVGTYQGKWNTIAGYIDEDKPVEDIVRKEVLEELGISGQQIGKIHLGQPLQIDDREIKKIWIVYPALVELNEKPAIEIDWEHIEYRWIHIEEIEQYDTVYRLEDSLKRVL